MKETIKKIVGCFEIKNYQMEDFINILLNNNYLIEIEKCTENSVMITAYKIVDKESEE